MVYIYLIVTYLQVLFSLTSYTYEMLIVDIE